MEIVKDEDMNIGKHRGHRRYNDVQKCYKTLRSRDKWKYQDYETKDE